MNQETTAIATARVPVGPLSAEDVARELASSEALLIDVREPRERAAYGSIPRDMHIQGGAIECFADPNSPYRRVDFTVSRRIILYCDSGTRSARVADAMRRLGYQRVAHLDGGLAAWDADGKPVEWAG
jgi:rhodanese-related sulfurtransferase